MRALHFSYLFTGNVALCEYLCAMVGPVLSKKNAPKHAAALHLPLLRNQLHLRHVVASVHQWYHRSSSHLLASAAAVHMLPHLPLCRHDKAFNDTLLHARGDSAGAAAIQGMLFWTRPDSGLLASCLCRWATQLRRRRAKVQHYSICQRNYIAFQCLLPACAPH